MLISPTLAQKTKEKIQTASRVCFLMHSKPDMDTVGAALALIFSPCFKNKKIFLFCPTIIPHQLLFLPRSDEISPDLSKAAEFAPDLIMSLDSSDTLVSGLEKLLPQWPNKPTIINLDHHKTNTFYGDLNLVDAEAASTTQILFSLFKQWDVDITREIASLLFLGLSSDTSGFSNPATSAASLEIAAELLSFGASFPRLQNSLTPKYSLNFLRQLGAILQETFLNPRWQIIVSIIKEEDLIKNNLSLEDVAGLTNLFNSLQEGRAALLIKETLDGFLQCSMRALKDEIDVSHLAKFLGGGGHAKAAGFTIKGKIVRMGEGWRVE